MKGARRALTALGVVVAVIGLFAFVDPTLAGAIFANEFYVSVIGLIALLQAGRVVRDARRSPVDYAETGDPELVEGVPTPGDGFDEALESTHDVHSFQGMGEVEDRLEQIGPAVLERRLDCSPAEANERLEAGSWTDDPLAAAFFSDEASDRIPLLTRLRIRWSKRSSFAVRAERAASELERVWRDEP